MALDAPLGIEIREGNKRGADASSQHAGDDTESILSAGRQRYRDFIDSLNRSKDQEIDKALLRRVG